MSRNDIIKQLSERIFGNATETEIQQCVQFCDTLVDIFTDALLENEKISWKGFINVEVIERGQRQGRHPQTNEVVVFPPVKSIKCRLSKSIKDMINEK